jgi:hypothetical protein
LIVTISKRRFGYCSRRRFAMLFVWARARALPLVPIFIDSLISVSFFSKLCDEKTYSPQRHRVHREKMKAPFLYPAGEVPAG